MFKTLEDVAKARQEATKQAEEAMIKSIPDDELTAVIADSIGHYKVGVDEFFALRKIKPLVLELITRFNTKRGK